MKPYEKLLQESGLELRMESDKGIYLLSPTLFNIFLEKLSCLRCWMTSIGGRLITNFRYPDDIVNAEEKEEAKVQRCV